MRPGRTTATQPSGAPFPLPMRVSAGFLVTGLSGKILIQTFPPRLTNRVMATRPASICLSVIHPGSKIFNPKSPKLTLLPLCALPRRRPLICFRYFTFLGINISDPRPRRGHSTMLFRALHAAPDLSLVDPDFHADGAIGGAGLGDAVVDVGAQRVERKLPLEVPLGPGDLGPRQPARAPNPDSLRSETQGGLNGLLHGATEGHAPLDLQGHGLRDQLGHDFGLVNLHDVDEDLPSRLLLDIVPKLVHLRAAPADDDAGPGRVDVDLELVGRALDLDLRHAGVRETALQLLAQVNVLQEKICVLLLGVPARQPGPSV